ncbi:MAG: hypothetical protein ABIO73_17995 [Polaromonas sp.]
MKILLYGINFAPERTGIGKYTGEMAKTGPVASLVTASSLRAKRGNPWTATAYGLAVTVKSRHCEPFDWLRTG